MQKILMLTCLFLSGPAFASGHFIHAQYVQAHFDGYAYGKKVRAVTAHAGILARQGPREFWLVEKDVALQSRGDHFFNKFLLLGTHNSAYTGGQLVIQYFIWFQDGSSQITQVYRMDPRSQHHQSTYDGCGEFSSEERALDSAPEAFRSATDSSRTLTDYRSCSHI
jgi:hypothetical protein